MTDCKKRCKCRRWFQEVLGLCERYDKDRGETTTLRYTQRSMGTGGPRRKVRNIEARVVKRSSNVFENQDGLTKEALVGEKWKRLGKKGKKRRYGWVRVPVGQYWN